MNWLIDLEQLAQFLVTKPRLFAAAARDCVRSLLDAAFQQLSPLPIAPPHVIAQLESRSVALPPRSMFAAGNQEQVGLTYLTALAQSIDARVLFEIGTYNGLTALTLARNLPRATIHTLDLAPRERPALPVFRTDSMHFSGSLKRVYQGEPEQARIIEHYGDSAHFDFSPYSHKCHLVYVDGAHSYDYVASDTRTAFSLVDQVAAIVWDDYWRYIPDIPRFLNSLGRTSVYRIPGSRLVVWLSSDAQTRLGALCSTAPGTNLRSLV